MSSYQFDQIKSFELDKFQSPAFPSSYLGGNKCSYTLQLDTFCPDWRNWSCFGEKNSCCEEKVFLWRKTACFEENLATLFLSPLLLVSRPPPAHICARFYPFHLFLTIMPPPTPSLVTAPLIHLSSQLSHILCDTFYTPPHPPRKIVTTSLWWPR